MFMTSPPYPETPQVHIKKLKIGCKRDLNDGQLQALLIL